MSYMIFPTYHITKKEKDKTLIRFLQEVVPTFSQLRLKNYIRNKKVAVFSGGKRLKVEAGMKVENGYEVKLFFPLSTGLSNKKSLEMIATTSFSKFDKVKTLFEDETLMVIDKPAGVVMHSGQDVEKGHSLIDFLVYQSKQKDPLAPIPQLVHRLDKDTSGLVIVAKTDPNREIMQKLIKDRKIEKHYIVLVKGKFSNPKDSIKLPIGKDMQSKTYNKMKVILDPKDPNAKPAKTLYDQIEYFPKLDATLLNVNLKTGRMHQIRVHFSYLGHPVAGDTVYGNFDWNRGLYKKYKLNRQFLHSHSIAFTHPQTGEKIEFQSRLPEELQSLTRV